MRQYFIQGSISYSVIYKALYTIYCSEIDTKNTKYKNTKMHKKQKYTAVQSKYLYPKIVS